MDPSESETQVLVSKPLASNISSPEPVSKQDQTWPNSDIFNPNYSKTPLSIFQEPIQWLQMLASNLNPSFIFGIFVVYGVSQGFSGSFFKVVTDYYWKDVQKVQPSQVQLYIGLYYIPWVLKPVWGILTDVFPIGGFKRKPYFVVAGVAGLVSALMVAFLGKLPVAVALSCLIGVTAGVAIADVIIDACIARNSIEMRNLAPDMQSLCGFCSSVGALIGYSSSGVFVDHLGPQMSLSFLAIPAALLIVLGFVIHEVRSSFSKCEQNQASENLGTAVSGMLKTIKCPQVWKPSLYMYLSIALSISTSEGQFYWYTDPKAGPAFSQEFIGIIHAIGAMASIVGVIIYQKVLKDYPFRNMLFCAQLFYALTGLLDVIFVRRWNLMLGIPDYFFVISEECVSRIVSRIRWMPMVVLSTRLCPLGIEGTFFALLMSIDSLGALSSRWGGGIVLHSLHVTRNDFTNLWLAILIRNISRFATLGLIFLIPKADQLDQFELDLVGNEGENDEHDGLQLVPKNAKNEEV